MLVDSTSKRPEGGWSSCVELGWTGLEVLLLCHLSVAFFPGHGTFLISRSFGVGKAFPFLFSFSFYAWDVHIHLASFMGIFHPLSLLAVCFMPCLSPHVTHHHSTVPIISILIIGNILCSPLFPAESCNALQKQEDRGLLALRLLLLPFLFFFAVSSLPWRLCVFHGYYRFFVPNCYVFENTPDIVAIKEFGLPFNGMVGVCLFWFMGLE